MKRYKFSAEITEELSKFKGYLLADRLDQNTVRQNSNYAGIFLEWLAEESIKKEEIRYKEIIAFIRDLQDRNYNTRFINRIILAVRYYYNYLKLGKNPASGIHLRGSKRTLPNNLVEYEEILSIYNQYQGLDNRTKRNRIMLGLMVYQAVTTDELKKLEPQHIKLTEGKIYVPGGKHSNARVLKLQATQLLEIQEYLLVVRPQMQKDITKNRGGRKPNKIDWDAVNNGLFFSENGSGNIKNGLLHLFRKIKKINPQITSGKVIRFSVIAEWLKSQGIRQVQYKAGHRYVSSTERYKNYNLEELTEAVHEFHPLN
jgi:integrase/recombinase XerD